ncbi:22838_t:CDS:2, partial [Racocetra persica]
LPLFAVGVVGILSSLVPCSHWCLVIASVVIGVIVITSVVVVVGLVPPLDFDFSSVLVNLRVSPAFLWNGFVFFSGVFISGIFSSYGACLVFVGFGNCADVAL